MFLAAARNRIVRGLVAIGVPVTNESRRWPGAQQHEWSRRDAGFNYLKGRAMTVCVLASTAETHLCVVLFAGFSSLEPSRPIFSPNREVRERSRHLPQSLMFRAQSNWNISFVEAPGDSDERKGANLFWQSGESLWDFVALFFKVAPPPFAPYIPFLKGNTRSGGSRYGEGRGQLVMVLRGPPSGLCQFLDDPVHYS